MPQSATHEQLHLRQGKLCKLQTHPWWLRGRRQGRQCGLHMLLWLRGCALPPLSAAVLDLLRICGWPATWLQVWRRLRSCIDWGCVAGLSLLQ